jgi:RNA polymerase sigma-70 factor, ECF subfamily
MIGRIIGEGQLVEIDAKRDGVLFEEPEEVLALNDALDRLEKFSPRQRQVVELRYFGGLTLEETAEAMDVSIVTVRRDWLAARAWLKGQITA